MENVDILTPPLFTPNGVVKTRQQAIKDEEWIGVFNLWIVQTLPVPALVYQQRSYDSKWAPGKLDVSAGGHYSAGEQLLDGLREAQEELGKTYASEEVTYLGRRINVTPDIRGAMCHRVSNIYMVTDNAPLSSYKLEESELSAIVACPLNQLRQLHEKDQPFDVVAISPTQQKSVLQVTQDLFPINWDNYHRKIVYLAQRYVQGEKKLFY